MTKYPNALITLHDPTIIGIALTQGQVAIIDIRDLPLVQQYQWSASWNPHTTTGTFEAVAKITDPDGKQVLLLMHRLVRGIVVLQE